MRNGQSKRGLVRRMVRAGVPEHQIAFKLGISMETLRAIFGEDIEREKSGKSAVLRVVMRDRDGKMLYDSWLK